jgi:plastocyanin
MRRALLVLAGVLLIPAVAYAGGGEVDTTGCAGYSEGTTVWMQDSCFSGVAHFAPSDTTITVTNDGVMPHTLTAVDGSFDTGNVDPGGTAELTIAEPGIYRVFCSWHGTAAGEGMAGVVVVGEATPAAMVTPVDTSAIQAVVAEENTAIVDQILDQRTRLQSLLTTQARVLQKVTEMASEEETDPAPAATPAVPESPDTERTVVLILVGLAAGIAVAALLAALRLGGAGDRKRGLERLEPEVGA